MGLLNDWLDEAVKNSYEKNKRKEPSLLDFVGDPQFKQDVANNAMSLAGFPAKSVAGQNGLPTEADLAKMTWIDLMGLRSKFKDEKDQNLLAPYEHRAYARESVNGPLSAAQQAVSAIGYTPYKAIFGGTRSAPSWNELGQGLLGVAEGLAK